MGDGQAVDKFSDWCAQNSLTVPFTRGIYSINQVIYNTNKFLEENMCQDGTTVNDRMFQSMNDVTHDYQLGSQYASTRALVEIPVFPNQFFQNSAEAIYPGPEFIP